MNLRMIRVLGSRQLFEFGSEKLGIDGIEVRVVVALVVADALLHIRSRLLVGLVEAVCFFLVMHS
jgi:hypothetical protein